MRIFLKIFLLIFSVKAFADCDLKESVTGVYSFSGSATVLIKELDLLKKSKLKGISIFHPIGEKEFPGRVLPGGIFLSQQGLDELTGQVVFYDESRDLKKILNSRRKVTAVEIRTRNLTPRQAVESTLEKMRPYLSGCEEKIKTLNLKLTSLEEALLKELPKTLDVVFYLGEFKNGRSPEMLMVQDGVVKWLIQKGKIRSYPSDLAYVNWSAKLMQEMPKETLHVGIVDSGRKLKQEIKKSSKITTLTYPGALIPGLSQLEAFLYWAKSL